MWKRDKWGTITPSASMPSCIRSTGRRSSVGCVGQRAGRKTAGWIAGGAVWRTVLAGDSVRRGGSAQSLAAGEGGKAAPYRPAGQRLGEEFRSEEGTEGVASRSGVRAPEGHHGMIPKFQSGLRRWREVKRRPV